MQMVPEATPPSWIATDDVGQVASNSTDVGMGNTRREINSFEGQPDAKDRECADCQRLRTLLYEEQRKPHVFHSECVQCQRRREARIRDAKQSLHYRMYSGESVDLNISLLYLLQRRKGVLL